LAVRARQLRVYRALANVYPALLAMALVVLVFRWLFPWLFSVLIYIWAADLIVLMVLAVPWLLVSWAFSSGRIKCPACNAAFAPRFHLWVPHACQSCGCKIGTHRAAATSDTR
jgi:hypothetical protein